MAGFITGLNRRTPAASLILGIWLFWATAAGAVPAAQKKITADPFPVPAAIKPNVAFWKSIFSTYDRDKGLIHDTRHLDRIYEIINLDPDRSEAASRKNKQTKKSAIQKYKTLLLALAGGKPPATPLAEKTAALFGPKARPADFKRAASRLRCQTGLKSHFKAGIVRSGAFIAEFRRIFRSHGLPEDLTYLPCVESSFDHRAYSKFGAAGVWQFTRGTGKLFMDINYVVDQRRDPYLSTDAAARLLKKNFSELKDWPCAITAYNHGLAGMRRAQKSKGNYENIFLSYSGRSFKFASRNFYSEFLAARDVAKNYKTHFGNIALSKPVPHTLFVTEGFLPVHHFANTVNLSILEFQDLNPSLREPIYAGQKHIPKGFRLRLPPRISKKNAVAAAKAHYHTSQKPSRFHVVKKGDTAGAIARKHQVALKDLMAANGLNRRGVIYIGQNLKIPDPAGTTVKPPPKTPAETPARKLPEDNKTVDPLMDVSDLKVSNIRKKGTRWVGTIRVEAEETLGHYAEWLGVPAVRLRALNRIKQKKALSIHQPVTIPLPRKNASAFEEKRLEFHREMEEDFFASFWVAGVDIYEVKNGDTIWALCEDELKVPFWLLKKFNPKMDFLNLTAGRKLVYPMVREKGAGPI